MIKQPDMVMTQSKITNELINQIVERLDQGKQVRRTLLSTGRLHIDRKLPFLIIYRPPKDQPDAGTSRLVKGEASYLIAPSSDCKKSGILKLVKRLMKLLSDEFGACLIIEVWAAATDQSEPNVEMLPPKPEFTLYTPKKQPPTKTVETLERSLKQIRISKRKATVQVAYWNSNGYKPTVLTEESARKMNGYVLGLEINPIYRNSITNEVFPLVLRRLHRSISIALRKAAFEFTKNRTTRKPPNYQVLGRRAFVKAVWEIDKKLAQISQSFDFLLQVTPINTELAWKQFKKYRFEKKPVFYYRPLSVDPGQLKRQLYQIPIEKVEDATLAFLFHEKQLEIDRQLTMLLDRDKRSFYHGSLQLYGEVTEQLLNTAKTILTKLPCRADIGVGRNILNAEQFSDYAQKEIQYYQDQYPEMSTHVQIRDDIVGLLVSQGNLLIANDCSIPAKHVEAALNHEVGTHILTYCNGKAQPFQQLYCGLAGYDELQEGLAVLSEFFVNGLSRQRLRLLAGRVLAAYEMQSGRTFVEVYHDLNLVYGFEQRISFNITARIFRGGGFVKDAVYLRGLIKLLDYLKSGGNIEVLYCGKISLDHVGIIEELLARKTLSQPQLTPRHMQLPDFDEKLTALQKGVDLFDLVTGVRNAHRFYGK